MININFIKGFIKTLRGAYPGVSLNISLKESINLGKRVKLNLNEIYVPRDSRNKGLGTKIIKDITDFCDTYDIELYVLASDLYGSNIIRLKKFYERAGFECQELGHDYAEMVRFPKKYL